MGGHRRKALLAAVGLLVAATAALGPAARAAAPRCFSENATKVGTSGRDVLRGTSGRDVIVGLGGNDVIYGLGAADLICGGDGADTIRGGPGDDEMMGNSGPDEICGGPGWDYLYGGSWYLRYGASDTDTLKGGGGEDSLEGGAGDDIIDGGDGRLDDAGYWGSPGPVTVDLALGVSSGKDGNDTITNIEWVQGSDFDDVLTGDAGDNLFWPSLGDDSIFGGLGFDEVSYIFSEAPVQADLATKTGEGEGSDTFDGIEGLWGSDHDDVLIGDDQDNTIWGGCCGEVGSDQISAGGGDDFLLPRGGADVIDGGPGDNDIVAYFFSESGVQVDLTQGTASGGEGADTLAAVESVWGSERADVLVGDAQVNIIYGDFGNDSIDGAGGDDQLDGEAGTDQIAGGEGVDQCLGENVTGCEGTTTPDEHPLTEIAKRHR